MSSNSALVTVPTWVVVGAGASSASLSATVGSGATGTVTLTGTFNGVSKSAQFGIGSSAPPVALGSLACSSSSITAPGTASCNVNLNGVAPTGGVGVKLSSNNAGVSIPASVLVPAGSSSAPFSTTAASGATGTVTLTGTFNGISKAAQLQITASSSAGTTYYIAPASAGGNDRNNGRSANAPWLTPNHALNCGDLILASPGSYDAQNFTINNWGPVSCPSGNNVAWLKCATFDTCRISTNSMSSGMWIDRSYWGVQGWEITTQKGGMEPACFLVAPNFNAPTEVHHVIFANNVANGCQGGGFSSANHQWQMIGVDYLAIVGNIAYNSTQGSSQCFTGISVYTPIASDSLPGTHIYLAGNFAWNNFNPDYCAGGPATDGEGMMFDELDGSNQGLPKQYAGQVVADNNILIANGASGFQVDHNNAGTGPWATIYSRHNTLWGNNHDLTVPWWGHGEWLFGSTVNTHSLLDLAVTNLQVGGGGHAASGFFVLDCPTTTNSVSQGWAYSPWGTNAIALNSTGFSYAANNVFGINPQLRNPVIPGAPSCGTSGNVPACMGTVISNFTPLNSSAQGFGYQRPSTIATSDALFPKWLCTVSNFPGGLVTMGCA